MDCVGMQQVEQHGYTGRPTPREVEQGQAGQGKREREGVESGYSTQNREDRDKEANKTGKSESEQIQYIDGEGCQVWRPQVMFPLMPHTQSTESPSLNDPLLHCISKQFILYKVPRNSLLGFTLNSLKEPNPTLSVLSSC